MSTDWTQAVRFTQDQYLALLNSDKAKKLFCLRGEYKAPPPNVPRLVAIGNKVVYAPCAYTPTRGVDVANTSDAVHLDGMFICESDIIRDLTASTNGGRVYELIEKIVALMFDPRLSLDGGIYLVYSDATIHNLICKRVPHIASRLATLYPDAKASILGGNLHVQYGDRASRIFCNITSLFTSTAGFVRNLFLMTSYILCGVGTPHTVVLDPYTERSINIVRVEPKRLVLYTQKHPTDLEYVLNLITSPLFWGHDDKDDNVLCYRFIPRNEYEKAPEIKKKRKLVKKFDRSEVNQPGYGALVIRTSMTGVRNAHKAAVMHIKTQ